MRQGIIGFIVGVLLVAAVYSIARKPQIAYPESGEREVVVVPGVVTKTGFVPGKVVVVNKTREVAKCVYTQRIAE